MIVIRDHRQFSRPTPPRSMPIASAVADFSHNLISCGQVTSMQWEYVTNSSFRSNRNARIITGETTSTIYLVIPVKSSNGTAHFRCKRVVLQPLSLQMRKWNNIFKQSTDYWTPIFVEKSIKNEFQIFGLLTLPSIDRHDNQVGRWLTNFRATWDPKFDSYAVVGSMKQPRQVRFSLLPRLLVSDPTCSEVYN